MLLTDIRLLITFSSFKLSENFMSVAMLLITDRARRTLSVSRALHVSYSHSVEDLEESRTYFVRRGVPPLLTLI